MVTVAGISKLLHLVVVEQRQIPIRLLIKRQERWLIIGVRRARLFPIYVSFFNELIIANANQLVLKHGTPRSGSESEWGVGFAENALGKLRE